jgi:hypothetical protein
MVGVSLYIGSMGVTILFVRNGKYVEFVTNVHVGFFTHQEQTLKE